MEVTICNPQKGRLETIAASMNETNTTWFDGCQQTDDIYTITDIEGDLLIKENNFRTLDLAPRPRAVCSIVMY